MREDYGVFGCFYEQAVSFWRKVPWGARKSDVKGSRMFILYELCRSAYSCSSKGPRLDMRESDVSSGEVAARNLALEWNCRNDCLITRVLL